MKVFCIGAVTIFAAFAPPVFAQSNVKKLSAADGWQIVFAHQGKSAPRVVCLRSLDPSGKNAMLAYSVQRWKSGGGKKRKQISHSINGGEWGITCFSFLSGFKYEIHASSMSPAAKIEAGLSRCAFPAREGQIHYGCNISGPKAKIRLTLSDGAFAPN